MSFTQFNLDARINKAIQRVGFDDPTPIQSAAIPLAVAGRDLIATAQTGTGKTAAFVLPILQKLIRGPQRQTRSLIITPTRELAEQIHQMIGQLSYGTNIRSTTIYGGVGAAPQIEALKSGVEIVVACPGRLLDHLNNRLADLSKIEILVLDEADRMLDMGFLPDIKRILGKLPKQRQTMLFSATFPREIEDLARQTLQNPQRVAVGIVRPPQTIEQTLFPVPQHLKNRLLMDLLKDLDARSILVFTRTKYRAMNLLKKIKRTEFKVTSLHGDRTQGQRRQALNGFREGRYQIMVATDIAARGLDIDGISHVINFDMPATADAYIHRIGRTGRAERSGEAFTFITPDDLALVTKIEKILKRKLPRKSIPDFDYSIPRPVHQQGTNKRRPPKSVYHK